ncbi:MAG TPA: HAD family phosphatase [Ignavibacteria bacterium]|nr:HAD family phosphatase [Ignavibacteria bacterium]
MIKNIIFDLGNVLVNVLYGQFREKIYNSNISKERYDDFFMNGNYRLLGYESGIIDTDEFVNRCISGLNLNMTSDEFIDAFNNMFSEITPMKEVVSSLSSQGKYRLFLLSNTSPLHWDFARKNFDFVNKLEKFGLSYELKSLKPEKEIFERAIKHFDINPDECLFIDDLPENCKSAEKCGIKSIVYDKNDHEKFMGEFEKVLG